MEAKFSPANRKLRKLEEKTNKKVYSFDLLSGVSCPFASACHSWAKVVTVNGKKTRRIVDGPHCKFRCYSASEEVTFPFVYLYRKNNSKILKLSFKGMVKTLSEALPKNAEIVRIHASGDFASQCYFDAWVTIARRNPDKVFYTYTKALPYWIKRKGDLPRNLVLTASYGGTHDHLIRIHRLRSVRVVLQEGVRDSIAHRRLPVDKTDFIAYNPSSRKRNFSLLIHGVQPKGSVEAKFAYKQKVWKNV